MRSIRKFGLFAAIVLATLSLFGARPAAAQETEPTAIAADAAQSEDATLDPALFPPDEFYRGEVVEVVAEGEREISGVVRPYRLTRVRIMNGPDRGKDFEFEHSGRFAAYELGDKVVAVKVTAAGETTYAIADNYRLPALAGALLLFLAVAAWFGRARGLMSVLGLAFSILVLAKFVVPRIMAGHDPLATTLLAAGAIIVVSLLLAHGFETRTFIAMGSTALTLGLAVIAALLAVSATKLFGLGSEDAAFLQLGTLETINFRGLLLGGIIIGTLGVLDDITTAQTAAVEEIGRANGSLNPAELYRRGLSVGREHIASLVNTLVLAYAGASLPLFLLFTINKSLPLWVTLNSETVAEEVVRTLVGSFALILAVPISTGFAALVFGRRSAAISGQK